MTRGNRLLDRLIERWPPLADGAQLTQCDQGDPVDGRAGLLFPAHSVISLMTGAGGRSTELALTGSDGCVGAPLRWRRDGFAPGVHAEVTIGGSGWRVGHDEVDAAIVADVGVGETLIAHGVGIEAQIARQAHCNRLHSIDERVCRWLLTASDRIGGDSLEITQSFLADRLAVRRASVNVVQRRLQSSGAIDYGKGRIRLRDREQLTEQACDCYRFLADQTALAHD